MTYDDNPFGFGTGPQPGPPPQSEEKPRGPAFATLFPRVDMQFMYGDAALEILDARRIEAMLQSLAVLGDVAVACRQAGVHPATWRQAQAADAGLREDIEYAQQQHGGALYLTALWRGTDGGSDTILGKLLDAKATGFNSEERKAQAQLTRETARKAHVVVLRNFEEVDGSVREVQPDAKPDSDPPRKGPPLRLEHYRGII